MVLFGLWGFCGVVSSSFFFSALGFSIHIPLEHSYQVSLIIQVVVVVVVDPLLLTLPLLTLP